MVDENESKIYVSTAATQLNVCGRGVKVIGTKGGGAPE